MRKKLSLLIILLLVIAAGSGCADKRPKYKNSAFEFVISYVPGWEVRQQVDSAIVAFIRPKVEKLDFFQETLTITVDDLPEPVTLSEYTDAAVAQIKAMGTMQNIQVNIIESAPMKISGRPGHKLVYTLTQYGNPPELVEKGLAPRVDTEGTSVQMMLAWTMHAQKAYLFTYVAQKEKYETYLKDVEAMLRSFRFL